jgi:isocitrate/isopropylmalate dehydrogenase
MLTYVTKSNAMRNGMVMWDEVINEVASEFPDVVSRFDAAYIRIKLIGRPWTTCLLMP